MHVRPCRDNAVSESVQTVEAAEAATVAVSVLRKGAVSKRRRRPAHLRPAQVNMFNAHLCYNELPEHIRCET
jgi:hypothetical protein